MTLRCLSLQVNGDGATLVSAMTVTVSGGASLGGSTTFLGPGTVQLSGQTTVSADIILDQQVKVEVSSSSTMSWSGDSFSATLQESTTLQVSGGGVLQPMGVFTFGPSTLLEATSGGMVRRTCILSCYFPLGFGNDFCCEHDGVNNLLVLPTCVSPPIDPRVWVLDSGAGCITCIPLSSFGQWGF